MNNRKSALLASATATAILGIDTLWGGDVHEPVRHGSFIADSWFSDEPLPKAYTASAAARLRRSGLGGSKIDSASSSVTCAVDVPAAIAEVWLAASAIGGVRGRISMACASAWR